LMRKHSDEEVLAAACGSEQRFATPGRCSKCGRAFGAEKFGAACMS